MGHVSSDDAENGSRNVIPIDPRLIEQFTDWGVRLEKRVPPEGDKQSCRHSMAGPVEYNGTQRRKEGRAAFFQSVSCSGRITQGWHWTCTEAEGRPGNWLGPWNMPLRAIRRPITFFLRRMACQGLPVLVCNPSWHPSPATTRTDAFHFPYSGRKALQLASWKSSTTSQRGGPEGL